MASCSPSSGPAPARRQTVDNLEHAMALLMLLERELHEGQLRTAGPTRASAGRARLLREGATLLATGADLVGKGAELRALSVADWAHQVAAWVAEMRTYHGDGVDQE